MARGDWSRDDWARFLSERLDHDVIVSFGRSRSAPVQARSVKAPRDPGGKRPREADSYVWEVRLHAMFVSTPPEVREALVKWLRVGRRATKAGPVLDRWIHSQIAALPQRVRRITLTPLGEVHNLTELSAPLYDGEFATEYGPGTESKRPGISWGRRTRSRSRRSIRLGSFEPESRVVRIHPVLDQEAVPAWFVTFVLKHEILHSVIDAYRDASGRWVHHGPEFREREESWDEYAPAMEWERRNLARLIRSAREGTRLQVRPGDLAWPGANASPLPRKAPEPPPPVAARRARERNGPTPSQGSLFDI